MTVVLETKWAAAAAAAAAADDDDDDDDDHDGGGGGKLPLPSAHPTSRTAAIIISSHRIIGVPERLRTSVRARSS